MEKKILSVILVVLLCVPLLLAVNSARTEQAAFKPRKYETQNVIMLNTDGLRYIDGLGSKEKYMKHVWEDIRPNGAMFTGMWNQTCTYTAPGHAQCVTGAWQYEPNNGRIRPSTPTIFEYYRRQINSPIEDVCILPGKGNCWHLNYSSFPGFGRDYGAPFYALGAKDEEIVAKLKELMNTVKPKLVYAIMPEVDAIGHSGDFAKYSAAIAHADELIWDVWSAIQSNPSYKDKTTLIITTDHGRHSEGRLDGFKSHGDSCEGCRHTYAVMIGPDIKKGFVYEKESFQVDLVPTIGQLLGVATPACDGKPLLEVLVDRPLKEIPEEQKAYILSLEQEAKRFLDVKYKALLPVVLDASLKISVETLGHSLDDAIFLNGVLDASNTLSSAKGYEYVKGWADKWIADGLKLEEISDSACGQVLARLYEKTKNEQYRQKAKQVADWVVSAPFGKTDKGAVLSKPIKLPIAQGREIKQVRAENLYAIMPLMAHVYKLENGDYLKFGFAQWMSHKVHLSDPSTGLVRHYATIGVAEDLNPIIWARGNAYALCGLLEGASILKDDEGPSKQFDQLISNDPIGDELYQRQTQSGAWSDDLSGQVSDVDTVASCLILGATAKWQQDRFAKRLESKQLQQEFVWEDLQPMAATPKPKKTRGESALKGSLHHVIGGWENWKWMVSSTGQVFGSAAPAQNIQRGYEGFAPPVYSRDRGFFVEGQGAYMSALANISGLALKLSPLHFRLPPIK